MKVRFLSASAEELAESALYYLEESPQAALHFEEEVERAVAEIAEAPLRYPIHSGKERVKVLDRFPFSIYYRVLADEIQIVSIAHHARMPGYWRGRIQ